MWRKLHPKVQLLQRKEGGMSTGLPAGLPIKENPEVVCTVRLAIGFLLVLSKWCAQSRLAIGF
jgi:hypothetical protein